jgi:chondroitin AC lyase
MKKTYIIISLFLLVMLLSSSAFAQNEFKKIRTAIVINLLNEQNVTSLGKEIPGYLNSLQANGAWPDIDYASTKNTVWSAGQHLVRVQTIVKGFVNNKSKYYADQNLYSSILSALQLWYDKDCKSANWWHNQIATPQSLGEIMILMKEGPRLLPAKLQDSLLVRMKRGEMWRQTGANKLDIALHNIYRASITEDAALMDSSVREAFQPISFTTSEGLQYDFSNMQHGRQMMIGSYGFVFVNGEYKIASFLLGTHYAISVDKLKILSTYFCEVFLKSIRGSYMDFNTEGRGISRINILDKKITVEKRSLHNLISMAMMLDIDKRNFLLAAEERLSQRQLASYSITPYHVHFWKADYTIHNRPAFSFNVRTVSARTVRTESGNDENLLGNFLPDGATDIQRRGGEYNNIQPIWEWDKIPGVTNRDYGTDEGARITKYWGVSGSPTAFAGGVSDSVYGVTAYDLNYDSVSAKKSWFFFDKEVVCLGAGISSKAPEHITTTINQSWLNGQIKSSAFTGILKSNSISSLKDPKWIWHDSIGYFFPCGGNINVSNQIQTGNWNRINKSYPKVEIKGNVFKLWFDHNDKPNYKNYAYIVVPGLNNEKEMKQYSVADIRIENNSSAIQAVSNTKLDMLQVVFYEAGTLNTPSISVSADKPCILYLKNISSNNPVLYISDPLQKNRNIIITLKFGKHTLTPINCLLPTLIYSGSTTKFSIDKNAE